VFIHLVRLLLVGNLASTMASTTALRAFPSLQAPGSQILPSPDLVSPYLILLSLDLYRPTHRPAWSSSQPAFGRNECFAKRVNFFVYGLRIGHCPGDFLSQDFAVPPS
jgi:hypothetical protein